MTYASSVAVIASDASFKERWCTEKYITMSTDFLLFFFVEQEHDLVALIPVRDRRLKPRRT